MKISSLSQNGFHYVERPVSYLQMLVTAGAKHDQIVLTAIPAPVRALSCIMMDRQPLAWQG